mmetsp:Transcript_66129/g.149272  ORF Transcript_66129/g.149272 Transcript_66129/m.149272 type:complete len:271 (-) Transcript_66129:20-832(-)
MDRILESCVAQDLATDRLELGQVLKALQDALGIGGVDPVVVAHVLMSFAKPDQASDEEGPKRTFCLDADKVAVFAAHQVFRRAAHSFHQACSSLPPTGDTAGGDTHLELEGKDLFEAWEMALPLDVAKASSAPGASCFAGGHVRLLRGVAVPVEANPSDPIGLAQAAAASGAASGAAEADQDGALQSLAAGQWRYLPEKGLSKDPTTRLDTLFKVGGAWTRAALAPYLEPLVGSTSKDRAKAVASLLLKHTRAVTTFADAAQKEPVFCPR